MLARTWRNHPSWAAGGGVRHWPLGEQAVWQLLKSLTVEFLYDPAIPLVGVQPREMMTRVHANAAAGTLRAPLFVTAERERQPGTPFG